jgi:hypothetical protein
MSFVEPAIFNFETLFIRSLGIAHTPKAESKSADNGERDELLSKSKNELLLLAKRLLPPKLWPRSSSSKADIADAIRKARRQPKTHRSWPFQHFHRLLLDNLIEVFSVAIFTKNPPV